MVQGALWDCSSPRSSRCSTGMHWRVNAKHCPLHWTEKGLRPLGRGRQRTFCWLEQGRMLGRYWQAKQQGDKEESVIYIYFMLAKSTKPYQYPSLYALPFPYFKRIIGYNIVSMGKWILSTQISASPCAVSIGTRARPGEPRHLLCELPGLRV